ncbi:MAG: 8-amino-7-oxononanoate synthase [Pyrinomonas sp.]|uniref:8-amino-7-oxononanoate synthase n=1 Tax=Pyrinomonas sp. TaxID=2080306 RepID=UPI00332C0F90
MRVQWTETLDRLSARSLRRELRRFDRAGPVITAKGQRLINLASNNYLGLADDPRLIAAAKEALELYGLGASASPLVCGHLEAHERLEAGLASFKGTEAALVFSSGYATNVGVLSALATPRDAIFLDALVHASLHDGARLSGAEVRRYRHADVDDLRRLLRASSKRGARIVVTDGVFSMDGDLAPLPELVELCEELDALLVVDDAHGTGVIGPGGRGTAAHFGIEDRVPVQIGTLSKALGLQGGFVVGSEALIRFIVNRARAFIYSTAISPALAAAALCALKVVEGEPWRRQAAREHRRRLSDGLREKGYEVKGDPLAPMLLVMIGEAEQALKLAVDLENAGVFAPAIRPPTVPQGTSRIRLAPMATHSSEQIAQALDAFPNGL